MNNPELYHSNNGILKQITLECLSEHAQHIKWNKIEDTALDIGCGDGSMSVILKNHATHHNHSYKRFVACDVNKNMIEFAKKRYSDEDIVFKLCNIEDDVSEDLGAFNHVFSFYALHWVKKQEKAFQNIYNLLADDGDIFISLIANNALHSVYKVLAQKPKWKTFLKEVDIFVSPYHDVQNPEKKMEALLVKCGFKNINIKAKTYPTIYHSTEALKRLVQSIEPFNTPPKVFDELFEDLCTMGKEIGVINFDYNGNGDAVRITYDCTILIIAANK